MRKAGGVAAASVATRGDDFVEVYERTVTAVYSYFASRVGERATAEDLTQDVFIVGASRVAAGEPVDIGWLIGVARHKLVDHWRAREREGRNLALVRSLEAASADVDGAWIEPGRAAVALEGLNSTYRAALVLRHVDGLSVPAVAGHLGRTVAATEQVLVRARAAFRSIYQGSADE
jgi:RNA polymerase sigma-70 factor, ECF subfamily